MYKIKYASTVKLIAISSFAIFLNSCSHQKKPDRDLQTPDIDNAGMNHGYSLTLLGSLLYRPWAYYMDNGEQFSQTIYLNQKELSSKGIPYSEIQKDLVFELQKDGSLNYWFKKDYIESPNDTLVLPDGSKSFSHTTKPSGKLKLKKIYTSGTWKSNFKDSTISIDFGINDFQLQRINGKFV